MLSIGQRIAAELNAQEWQVKAAIDLLDARLDGSVHRPLPQGSHRHPRRCAASYPGRTPSIPARTGRSPQGDSRQRPRARQADRRAAGPARAEPTPRLGSKTSIFPTSQNGAPRRRSPGRPGWSLLPIFCSTSRRTTRRSRPFLCGSGRRTWRRVEAALEGARAILVERFAEHAELLGALRDTLLAARQASPRRSATARRPRAPSSPITSTSPSRSPSCRPTASSRCSAAKRKRSSTCGWTRTRTAPNPAYASPL